MPSAPQAADNNASLGELSQEYDAYSWWRREGCAGSYGSLATTSIVFIIFDFFWLLACQRLIQTVINQRMRGRLRLVQIVFVMTPLSLVVLRALLIFLPANWFVTRRLLKTAEILVILITALISVASLLVRPIQEDGGLEDELVCKVDKAPAQMSAHHSALSTQVVMNTPRAPPALHIRGDAAHFGMDNSSCDGFGISDANDSSHGFRRRLLHLFRPPHQFQQWPTANVAVDLYSSPQRPRVTLDESELSAKAISANAHQLSTRQASRPREQPLDSGAVAVADSCSRLHLGLTSTAERSDPSRRTANHEAGKVELVRMSEL